MTEVTYMISGVHVFIYMKDKINKHTERERDKPQTFSMCIRDNYHVTMILNKDVPVQLLDTSSWLQRVTRQGAGNHKYMKYCVSV